MLRAFLRVFVLALLASVWLAPRGAIAQPAPQSLPDFSQPGPFFASSRTITVTRPNASTFTARVHYPASAAGASQPFAPAAAPAPAVTFGHGFLQPTTRYLSIFDHLASWGIVVIASDSEGGLFPNHANFALDLRHSLTWLEQQTANPASFLFGAIDVRRFGASGHSMGGGASMLAAAADRRIVALANLAAADTNPSSIAAAASVRVPMMLLSGSNDTIVPVASNGQAMFNACPAPVQLPIIAGGYHCGFQDQDAPIGCDSGAITRAQQLTITRSKLTEFFLYHLGDDAPQRAALFARVWGGVAQADAQLTPASRWRPCALDRTGDGLLTSDDAYAQSATPGDADCNGTTGPADVALLVRLLRDAEPRSLLDAQR